jgi:hypothetical protein
MGTIQNHAFYRWANPPSTMSENRRFASEAAMASIISFSLAMARSLSNEDSSFRIELSSADGRAAS